MKVAAASLGLSVGPVPSVEFNGSLGGVSWISGGNAVGFGNGPLGLGVGFLGLADNMTFESGSWPATSSSFLSYWRSSCRPRYHGVAGGHTYLLVSAREVHAWIDQLEGPCHGLWSARGAKRYLLLWSDQVTSVGADT